MKGRYLKKIGGFILAALMLSGVVFVSAGTVEAQHRRRVIIVRPYRPFGWSRWGTALWLPIWLGGNAIVSTSLADDAAVNQRLQAGFQDREGRWQEGEELQSRTLSLLQGGRLRQLR